MARKIRRSIIQPSKTSLEWFPTRRNCDYAEKVAELMRFHNKAAYLKSSCTIPHPFEYTVANWAGCLLFFSNCCAVCGERDTPKHLHPTHWVSLHTQMDKHPGTVPGNIVPMCQTCRFGKHYESGTGWLATRYTRSAIGIIERLVQDYFNSVQP